MKSRIGTIDFKAKKPAVGQAFYQMTDKYVFTHIFAFGTFSH